MPVKKNNNIKVTKQQNLTGISMLKAILAIVLFNLQLTIATTASGIDPYSYPDYNVSTSNIYSFLPASGISDTIRVRRQPLTARDSAIYQLLDSLDRARRMDKLIDAQKEIIKGYLPMGPLLLDIQHLAGYNKYEGLKLGLGLWTSRELTGNFSVGGYFNHAFKPQQNNYGGEIKWSLIPESRTTISVSYSNDMSTTGDFSFFQDNNLSTEILFKSLMASTKDRIIKSGTSLQTQLSNNFSGKLYWSHSEVTPVVPYRFNPGSTEANDAFINNEFGLSLRQVPETQPEESTVGDKTIYSNAPKVWFNLSTVKQSLAGKTSRLTKMETQVESTFRTGASAETTLRMTGGLIDGKATPTNLYSFFGTYTPFSIEVPYMFATMAPNEFAADRFALAFLNHEIPLIQNNNGSFNPVINLMTRAGWGTIRSGNSAMLNTFDKGFYESGILFDNLLSALFINYGFAVHYRYGPYQKNKEIDNWSFRLGIRFSL